MTILWFEACSIIRLPDDERPDDGLDLKARRYPAQRTRKALHWNPPRDDSDRRAPAPWRDLRCFSGRRTDHCRLGLTPSRFRPPARPLDAVLALPVTLPWYVIGFWNATIGLLIMRFARDPVAAVMPAAGRVRGDEPITASTAILLCIRNEAPERVARLLEPTMEGLAARGVAARFHVYVLSDTSKAEIAAAESAQFAALARHGTARSR